MVKFSKQFEAQLVPEWKDAFVDYWQLKKDLKRMQIVGDSKTEPSLFHKLFAKRIPFFGYNVNRDRDAIHVYIYIFLFSLFLFLISYLNTSTGLLHFFSVSVNYC